MASVQTSSYDGRYLKLTVTATAGTSSQNYSTVYWTIESIGGNSNYYTIYNYRVVVDGSNRDGDGSTVSWNSYKFPAAKGSQSGSFQVAHNSDGTPPRKISFALHGKVFNSGDENKTGEITLSTIPRYFSSTPTIKVDSRTETTAKISWTTPETCSRVQYKLDNGNWVDVVQDANAKSGSYTITGLTPGKTYTIYGDYMRRDSSLWAQTKPSATLSMYPYPSISNCKPFNIGDDVYFTLNNPRTLSCVIIVIGDDGTEISRATRNVNGDTHFGHTATEVANQYKSIPNKSKGNYKMRLVCSDLGRDTTVDGSTYSIKGTEIPNFSSSNWSYTANFTSLTNNDQCIIDRWSTITFKVNTAASSNYSATISKYNYKWGDKSETSTTVVKGTGTTLTVEAVDSRGLTNPQSKTLVSGSNYVPYNTPSLDYSNCSTHRKNGIEAETTLNLRGQLSVMKFGSNGVANAINSCYYRIYDYSASRWSAQYNIPVNKFTLNSNGVFTLKDFLIHENGSSGGFTIGKKYGLQIILMDAGGQLATLTSNTIPITDGKIARDVIQNSDGNYSEGINGLANPDYAETIYGTLHMEVPNTTDKIIDSSNMFINGSFDFHSKRNDDTYWWGIIDDTGTNKYFKYWPRLGLLEVEQFRLKNKSNLNDYVVDQGTSGIWYYRKWASGIAECWGKETKTNYNMNTAWGSLYEGPSFYLKFPTGFFIATPSIQLTPHTSSMAVLTLELNGVPSKEGTQLIYGVRSTAASTTLYVDCYALGRWK